MTEAPERIWINKVYGKHPEDWDFTDGKHLTKAQLRQKVEYVRADRIEELEAEVRRLESQCEGLAQAAINNGQGLIIAEAKLATCEEIGRAFEEDAGQLREKLAKAIVALDKIKRIDNLVGVFAACERTLAELKGETDD
jgi:hypothetical protein